MSEYKEPYVSDVREDGAGSVYEDDRDRNHERVQFEKAPVPASVEKHETTMNGFKDLSPDVVELIKAQIKNELRQEIREELGQAPTAAPGSNHPTERTKAQPMQRDNSQHTSSTPSPPPHVERVYTPPSPVHSTRRRPSSPRLPTPSSPTFDHASTAASMSYEKPAVRFKNATSQNVDTSTRGDDKRSSKRTQLGRTFSTAELSTIDQKWGTLFGADREPRPRLGQILRGLANHLVDEFEPKRSIVIPPQKMAEFYARFPLEKEIHPFLQIFQSEAYSNISTLYRDLHCEHHLIAPLSPSQAPHVPALTPNGFANWLTLFIVSHPDMEHDRLDKIVLALPIDADQCLVDGKPERLPKQISRHLLPNTENDFRKNEVYMAISDFLDEAGLSKHGVRMSGSYVPPVSTHRPADVKVPPSVSQAKPIDIPISRPIERERHPYVNSPSSGDTAPELDNIIIPGGTRIERERQPYVATRGSGKTYVNSEDYKTTVNSSLQSERAHDRSSTVPPTSSRNGKDSLAEEHILQSMPPPARRESRAARDYVPQSRTGAPYRPPSPGIAPYPARNSAPINIASSASVDRENKYGSSYSASQTFSTPASYLANDGKAPVVVDPRIDKPKERDRSEVGEVSSRRDRDRSDIHDSVRDREKEREKDRDRDRERERERDRDRDERNVSGRLRRGTVEERTVPGVPLGPRDMYERERGERDRDDENGYRYENTYTRH